MKYYSVLLGSLLYACLLTLTACGGGGSDNDNANNTNPPDDDGNTGGNGQRITVIRYDFDNNGTAEGVANLSYDVDGRIERIEYNYNDDGTQDTDFETFSLDFGSENASHDYAYDNQGRLITWIITKDTSRLENLYTWNDGNLLTNYEVEFYDSFGGLQNTVRFAMAYDNGQLISWTEEFDTGSGAMPLADAMLTYDDVTGLPSVISRTDQLSSVTEDMAYNFLADGKINTITTTNPDIVDFEKTVQFFYAEETTEEVQEGYIVNRRVMADDPDNNYQWVYIYEDGLLSIQNIDLDSDLTREASITFEWEDGTCQPTYLWQPRAEPNFKAENNEPFIPATGYVKRDYCDTRGSRV